MQIEARIQLFVVVLKQNIFPSIKVMFVVFEVVIRFMYTIFHKLIYFEFYHVHRF